MDRSLTILTEYFHPEQASTAQLLTDLATGLADAFDVSIVTGRPSYHDEDRGRSVPRRETHEGVDITRVRATRFDKDSLPLRVINWLSFSLLATIRILLRGRTGALLVLSNPPVLPFGAWLSKRVRGTPYVYLVYDMYPDMPVALEIIPDGGIIARVWEWAMREVYRDADRIVVLGDSMERRLVEKMADDDGFDPESVRVIHNWEDPEFIEPKPKGENEFARDRGTLEPFTLVYSGNIGQYHELETAIRAFETLEERGRTDVQFLIIGEGGRKEHLERMVEEKGLDAVRFLPFQPKERLPETLTCGDASLVGIDPGMAGMCVSSKLYSSLAAGMPVLAVVAEADEVARVVEAANCGAHVEPGDVERAADIIERWADDPNRRDELGTNARQCFEQHYTRERSIRAYENLFAELVSVE